MWDVALGSIVKSNKDDATIECEEFEECKEVTLEVEVVDSSLYADKVVIRFVLAFVPFLGV